MPMNLQQPLGTIRLRSAKDERERIRKLALEPSDAFITDIRLRTIHGISEIDLRIVLRAFAEEIGP